VPDDPFLADVIAAVREDPETLGLLLHGSRSVGRHRTDSDYDLIRIVTTEAYEARRAAGVLIEKLTPDGRHKADVLYQTPSRIETYVMEPAWYTPTYVSAQILFDRTGEVRVLLARIAAEAGRIARERLPANYDDYLNCFVRSIKAARGGDELGTRLHAAASANALIRTLFGLQSTWPPYHDGLSAHLPQLETALGWPPGDLSDALLRLVRDGDPVFQQGLEERVERLMTSRGIAHEWAVDELEPLKTLRFPADRA
jgi:predicted nucleotidyltransferase